MSRQPSRSGSLVGIANPSLIAASYAGRSAITRITTPDRTRSRLIVEVADSSLADDRTLAAKVYGPARIPVYWIVNLVERQVEVYSDPCPAGYLSIEVFPEGQSVPVVIDRQQLGQIAVLDLLPFRPHG